MFIVWDFFIRHWLAVFWAMILGALFVIGVIKSVDEIRFRIERRRYQRVNK